MRETSLKGMVRTAQSTRQSLLRLVRGACEMLLSTHPSVAEAVTISRALQDGDSARLARKMVVRLAQEYGLHAEVRLNGATIVVRLSRRFLRLHQAERRRWAHG